MSLSSEGGWNEIGNRRRHLIGKPLDMEEVPLGERERESKDTKHAIFGRLSRRYL